MKARTTNRKAAPVERNGSRKLATNRGKFSPKSTATEAQHERVLRMLRRGPKNTFQFRRAGIMSPASRIRELNRKPGYYLPTVALRDLYDEQGFRHRGVAVYELVDEPRRSDVKRSK